MSDNKACKDFWCIHLDCSSYHTGDNCSSCNEYCECKSCIWQTESPLEDCHEVYDQVMRGISSDYDEW